MKKTFDLTHPKTKYPRMIEGVKSTIRKYIKREKKKDLPEGVDYWDFNCKFGEVEASAESIHLAEIDTYINKAEKDNLMSFYVEILAKGAKRKK